MSSILITRSKYKKGRPLDGLFFVNYVDDDALGELTAKDRTWCLSSYAGSSSVQFDGDSDCLHVSAIIRFVGPDKKQIFLPVRELREYAKLADFSNFESSIQVTIPCYSAHVECVAS